MLLVQRRLCRIAPALKFPSFLIYKTPKHLAGTENRICQQELHLVFFSIYLSLLLLLILFSSTVTKILRYTQSTNRPKFTSYRCSLCIRNTIEVIGNDQKSVSCNKQIECTYRCKIIAPTGQLKLVYFADNSLLIQRRLNFSIS